MIIMKMVMVILVIMIVMTIIITINMVTNVAPRLSLIMTYIFGHLCMSTNCWDHPHHHQRCHRCQVFIVQTAGTVWVQASSPPSSSRSTIPPSSPTSPKVLTYRLAKVQTILFSESKKRHRTHCHLKIGQRYVELKLSMHQQLAKNTCLTDLSMVRCHNSE